MNSDTIYCSFDESVDCLYVKDGTVISGVLAAPNQVDTKLLKGKKNNAKLCWRIRMYVSVPNPMYRPNLVYQIRSAIIIRFYAISNI